MQQTTMTPDERREATPRRSRKTEERRRRRRADFTQAAGRLGIDKSLIDEDKYAYRWINDKPGRMIAKTKHDDWDMIPNTGEKEDSTDLGAMASVVVGTLPDGSPMRSYLCRKPKTFYEEDYQKSQDALDQLMNHLKHGRDKSGKALSDYVPDGGIRM